MLLIFELVLGAVGVVGLILLAKAFAAEGGLRSLSPAALLSFASVVLPNLTTTVAMLLGERVVTVDPYFNRVVEYVGLSHQVNAVASPLLLTIAAFIAVFQLSRHHQINLPAAAFAGLLLIGALANWDQGNGFMAGGRITLLVVVLAAMVVDAGRNSLTGAAFGIGILVCLSAIGAAVQPAMAAPPCDDRKCGVLGTFYVGIADNQNTFGLTMALAVPVLFLGLRKFGIHFAFLAAFLALASGSRTGQIAAAFCIIAVVWIRANRRSGRSGGFRFAGATVTSAVIVGAVIPFMDLPPGTFSDRAGLWRLARSMIEQSWLYGFGPDLWRSLVDVRSIPLAAGYATHNQVLETLFTAGALGLVTMVVVVAGAIHQNRGHLKILGLLMVPVAIAAITERPWSLGAVDWATWSLVLFLTVSASKSNLPKSAETGGNMGRSASRDVFRGGQPNLSAGGSKK